MNSKYQIVVFIFALCLVERLQGQSSPCQECKSGPAPISCSIEGCTSSLCEVVRGSTVNANVSGIVPYLTNTLPTDVVVRVGTLVPVVVLRLKEEGCNYLSGGQKCPVGPNQLITNAISYHIDKSWPRVTARAEITVRDEKGNVVCCTILPIKIMDPQ